MDDAAIYNGKTIDLREKMAQIVSGMKDDPEFIGVVTQPRFASPKNISSIPKTQTLASFLSKAPAGHPVPDFEKMSFRDPFLVVYSSGTTGMPKCIVHSIGGALLNTAKEGRLHRELSPTSKTLQYTTTGWIMYFAAVTALIFGSHAVLYDGSPFQPTPRRFVELLGELQVTDLGVSPRWMQEVLKNGIVPKEATDLSKLRAVTSTGMVLPDHLFEWFYDVAFPKNVHLSNISGGTDLVSYPFLQYLISIRHLYTDCSYRLVALAWYVQPQTPLLQFQRPLTCSSRKILLHRFTSAVPKVQA